MQNNKIKRLVFVTCFAVCSVLFPSLAAAGWQYICIPDGSWYVYEAENQDDQPRLVGECSRSYCGAFENGKLKYTYSVTACTLYI